MVAHSRYLVIYKDSKHARNLYFGPFVSLTLAEVFMMELPDPLEGGSKSYRSFQPFDRNETRIACQMILDKRVHNDLLEVINSIVSNDKSFL